MGRLLATLLGGVITTTAWGQASESLSAADLRRLVELSGKSGANAVQECADRGEADCMLVLSELVAAGRFFVKDLIVSGTLLRMAAEAGSAEARSRMAQKPGAQRRVDVAPNVGLQSKSQATASAPLPPPDIQRPSAPPPAPPPVMPPRATAAAEPAPKRSTAISTAPVAQSRYERGQQILSSVSADSVIELRYLGVEKKRHQFDLTIINFSNRPWDISHASLEVGQGGSRLSVLSYEEADKVLRRSQGWQTFFAGLASGLDAYNASQAGETTYRGTYSGNTYGSGGFSATSYGTFTIHGTDQAARQAAINASNARSDAMLSQLQQAHSQQSGDLSNAYLRRQTLGPGGGYRGIVFVDRSKNRGVRGSPLDVRVRVGGTMHSLRISAPQ